jgi:putative zinc finger/helix-turn-helix YgiT family protein
MFNYKCENCKEGLVVPKKQKNYKVNIFDEAFVVKEAMIGECDECGTIAYNAKEMHRWNNLYKKWLHNSKLTLSSSKIVSTRKSLGLARQEFAELIGVTRQSISAWEQKKRQSVQPRSIDIIFRMLYDEVKSDSKPFTERLFDLLPDSSSIKSKINKNSEASISDKNYDLKKLLPVSIWNTLESKSKENNSNPFTETIELFMTHFYNREHFIKKVSVITNPEAWNKPSNISSLYHQAIKKGQIKQLVKSKCAEA